MKMGKACGEEKGKKKDCDEEWKVERRAKPKCFLFIFIYLWRIKVEEEADIFADWGELVRNEQERERERKGF